MKKILQRIILDFYYIYYFMIILDWYMTITRMMSCKYNLKIQDQIGYNIDVQYLSLKFIPLTLVKKTSFVTKFQLQATLATKNQYNNK